MIYYTPSAITESNTLLEKLKWIEDYLKKNPIAQIFLCKYAMSGISQYPLDQLEGKGEYNTANTGDIVLFKNGYVGIIDIITDNKFMIKDTVVLLKGDEGYRGEKGESYIVCNKVLELTENQLNNEEVFNIDINNIYYEDKQKMPINGSNVLFIGNNNNNKYIGFFLITGSAQDQYIRGHIITESVMNITGQKGEQGERGYQGYKGDKGDKGEDALMYKGSNLMFNVEDYNSLKGTTVTINKFDVSGIFNFNRTPQRYDSFIALAENNISVREKEILILNLIVNNYTDSAECGITEVLKINGDNGKKGDSVLLCYAIGDFTGVINKGISISYKITDFSTTPASDDNVIAVVKFKTEGENIGHIYIVTMRVGQISGEKVGCWVEDYQEIYAQGFNYMGEWVQNNEYHPYDIVKYNGNQYFCEKTIMDSITTPDLDTVNFSLFLQGGSNGGSSGGISLYKLPISGELGASAESLKYIKNNYNTISFVGDMTVEGSANIMYPNSCFFVADENDTETDNFISFNLAMEVEPAPNETPVPVAGILMFKFKNNASGEIVGTMHNLQISTQ